MMRVWTTCAAAVLVLGCPTGEEPARGAHRGVEPAGEYQPRPDRSGLRIDTPTPPPLERVTIGVETTEEEPERDLGAELKAAVGSPNDCVRDFVASSPTTIRINVTAIVRPTGMVIQPSAYGSGLSAAALNCIKVRVGTIVLKPLDDTVSESVSTVIEINYQPDVIVESEPGVPEPQLRNVKEPLPKRPEVAPSGKPIMKPTSKPIQDSTGKDPNGPQGVPVTGPKPRAIDGYEIDENAQQWR
jgi:hypothetical protein